MHRRDIPDDEIIECFKNYWRAMKIIRLDPPVERNYEPASSQLPYYVLPYPEKLIKAKCYRMSQQGKLDPINSMIYEVPGWQPE